MPLPLLALALAAFAIGTTEFVIMGLLPQVAGSLGVSIPAAGWLISAYALGVTIGAPIMAVATAKLPRRAALAGLMGIFILGNALCALAPGYGFLMAARIVTALCHGAFFGIGSVVAADLVAPNRRASAIALMFTGLTLANVLGVPLGTALGQAAGWRATFWAVAGVGVAAFLALVALLPRGRQAAAPPILAEFAAIGRDAWLALATTAVFSASVFALFTYIAPILLQVTGISAHGVTLTLFLVGIGLTLGNIAGGRLSDWRLGATLLATFAGMALVLLGFAWGDRSVVTAEVVLFAWAFLTFMGVPALQINVVAAGKAAPNLISTLNIGAFNAGNALGAWVGGAVIARGYGLPLVPVAASALAALAFLLGLAAVPRLRAGRLPAAT